MQNPRFSAHLLGRSLLKPKVAELTSILLAGDNVQSGLNIQQPLYNNHYAKLIETENKLNQVFEEYTGRIEAFMLMLDSLSEGVLLVNKVNEVCFTNETGGSLLKNSGNVLLEHLSYRDRTAEEVLVLSCSETHEFHIRIKNFFWNSEPCNIFIIQKNEIVKHQPILDAPPTVHEPFGSMMNYLQLIAAHEANGRTTEATQCASLAINSIAQSDKFLSDIKAFVRLANYKPAMAKVSMQKIAGDVLKSMGPEIEEAQIELTVSELPETIGDKDLIIILLKQLISNSLKFRNKGRKAIIDIGHDKSEGQFIFCVRDNGIGISKKHHEEVFNLFSALNDRSEYPGNGMGLAICKKIIELHDGKIWVESLPGHGSNFYFKLNAKQ